MCNTSAYKKKFLSLLVFAGTCIIAFSQTNISGVINKYAAVTVIDFCNNNVTVNSTTGFFVGQRVMIIQMKGAEIDATNTAAFGNINDYRACGNYEIDEIKTITGNVIEFKYALIRDYQANGSVQLVSLEEYTDAIVNAPLTAQAWDGSTGGILLLKTNTLTLNDSITVKGKGFRGALYENDNAAQACYNGTGGATDYYCGTVNCGAPKGEGIGTSGFGYGRGKNGNGGGGGDDHNTGGGGGGNYGAGGIGGRRSNETASQCHGPAPGVGGAGLTYSTGNNKIFMGGGGGAGDGNNNQGTHGANGGGIVIIMCNNLTGNNKRINANGNPVDSVVVFNCCYAQSDGAGGGGGAGTVLLYADNYTGNIRVDAVGGTGGYLDNGGSTGTNAFCMGPGGGGGGGVLWVKGSSVPTNILLVDTGGINGNNKYGLGPAGCPYGTTNGAQPGNDGGSITDLNIPLDSIPFVKLTANACCDTTVCSGATVLMNVTDTASLPPTVLWSTGSSSQTISLDVLSTTPFSVTATDVLHSCTVTQTVTATVLNTLPDVTICCDTTVCIGAYASFNVAISSGGQFTYEWSNGANTAATTQQILGSQAIYVTVTDESGCSVEQSVIAFASNNPPSLSVCCDTIVCVGNEVTMTATSSSQVSYSWSSGQTTSGITQMVNSPATFIVTITDANGCVAVQSVNAFISSTQTSIAAIPDTAIFPGQTVQLIATGDSAYIFTWSPAAGLNNANVYNPQASPDATTTYCVTVSNELNCTSTACHAIEVIQPNIIIKVPDAFAPNGSDVKNHSFMIFPIGDAEIIEIRIYNRWGEVVFYSKGNAAWDGTYQGKPQPTGAYVCNISYGSVLNPVNVKSLVKDFILVR